MTAALPAGWGFPPAGFTMPQQAEPAPIQRTRRKRQPRPWWQLSDAEQEIAARVRESGLAATIGGTELRNTFGVRWDKACRIARYCRAEANGSLPISPPSRPRDPAVSAVPKRNCP
jgi:hypothetical protein